MIRRSGDPISLGGIGASAGFAGRWRRLREERRRGRTGGVGRGVGMSLGDGMGGGVTREGERGNVEIGMILL